MDSTTGLDWFKSSFSFANSNCVEIAFAKSTFSANGSCVQVGWQKSSQSYANGQCLEVGYGKSSLSTNNGSCIEVGDGSDGSGACGLIHVRDSKLGDASPVLDFTPAEWSAFVQGVRAGEFDLS